MKTTLRFSIFFLICIASSLGGDFEPHRKHVVSITAENDLFSAPIDSTFGFPDRYYTAGDGVLYTSPEHGKSDGVGASGWADIVSFMSSTDPLGAITGTNPYIRYTLGIVQEIYTPKGRDDEEFNRDDRPYAGVLKAHFGLSYRRPFSIQHMILEAGVLGKSALGKETQDFVHDLLRIPKFKGWHTQISNVAYAQIGYSYTHRIPIVRESQFEFDSLVGASTFVGTSTARADLVFHARLGHNLDSNFLVPKLVARRSNTIHSDNFYAYIYGGMILSGVWYDTLVTGHKHGFNNLELKRYRHSFEYGFSIGHGGSGVSMAFTHQDHEFNSQKYPNIIGSLTLGIAF